ncbi:MAG: type VI secretion system tube protein Hcp [Acidimicrobiales bacterium]
MSAALVAAIAGVGASGAGAAQSAGGQAAPSRTAHFVGANAVYSMSAPPIAGAGGTGGPGNIQVTSFQWASKVKTVVIVRKLDVSSSGFFHFSTDVKPIQTATLYVTPPAGATGSSADAATLTFNSVRVTGISWSGAGSGEIPKETVVLTYSTVNLVYTPGG